MDIDGMFSSLAAVRRGSVRTCPSLSYGAGVGSAKEDMTYRGDTLHSKRLKDCAGPWRSFSAIKWCFECR